MESSNMFWMTFPVTETITTVVGIIYYRQFTKSVDVEKEREPVMEDAVIKPSHPGAIITIAREHGDSPREMSLHIRFVSPSSRERLHRRRQMKLGMKPV